MQARLVAGQGVFHLLVPVMIQPPHDIEHHPAMGADRACGERQFDPAVGLDTARRHRHHVGMRQQPVRERLLHIGHVAIGITRDVQRCDVLFNVSRRFARGLEQGVVQIDEDQRAVVTHRR